jgi:sporulation protein YlmC with PRC-barrel domain
MKTKILKIAVICAACSMGASAWAQSQDQPSSDSSANRSWSTKQLTATGRNTEKSVRASKLTGAQVSDSSGQRVGTIQDVIINANSGRIDFALLSLNPNSSSSSSSTHSSSARDSKSIMASGNPSGKLVPVPWALLKTSASSSQYSLSSEQPAFTVNVEQKKLNSAPTIDMSDLNQSEWQQRIYSYYGVTPQSVGGAESPQGVIKGEGVRRMQESTPPRQPTP